MNRPWWASKTVRVIGWVLVGLALVIVLQNLQDVQTKVLLWRFTLPHAVLLGIMLLVGILCGLVVSAMWRGGRRLQE